MNNRELADAAWAEGLKSTISGIEWLNRKTNGYKGKPYNWQATAFGRQKLLLDQIDPNLQVSTPVGPFDIVDEQGTATAGIFARTTGTVEIKKTHVKNVTGYGIGSMQYYPPTVENPGRTIIEDCIVENVFSNPPKSMDGRGEAGFWFGNPTDARRLIARNCAWMGMWTGSKCYNSIIEDFSIESPYIGLYVEHETRDTIFRRFKIKTETGNGINIEWWYGGEGSYNLIFEDGDIYCPVDKYGIFVDAGTYGCIFKRTRFWGPGSAIALPTKLVDTAKPNIVEDSCVFENLSNKISYHNNIIG